MHEDAQPDRPEPRSSAEIFAELRALSQSDGALHEISAIVYRDWVLAIDPVAGRVKDDPERRWSTEKLNKNELMLLLGLAVQADTDRTYSVHVRDGLFAECADRLLREFHDRVLKDAAPGIDMSSRLFARPELIGLVAREAIYYGADSFYLHQFARFSRNRYRDDSTWLLRNVGLSVRPMLEIAQFIVDRINSQMTAIGSLLKAKGDIDHSDLTNSLLISKADVIKKFKDKANAFFEKFATPATRANASFVDAFSINSVAIAPLVDIGEYLYVPNQYRLLETIYESPFYWFLADKEYRDAAAQHRGKFLEATASHIFGSVFGPDHVHENVIIRDGSKDIAGEVDVLVVYGEFVLVVQAKSKRITLKARAGDTDALNNDFKGAIQEPYEQALECAKLIAKEAECVSARGELLKLPKVPRLFPVVVLSDPFPAATFLSGTMLERGNNIAPVIWDIGVLDCVARILPTPIEMIFYLKCRSAVFERVHSDSEYNFLGYHLKAKLALPDDVDWMMLDRDFASVIDDYMTAADVGLDGERPPGVLERLGVPVISELLAELKKAEPQIASIVIDLYDLSSAALEDLSANILELRDEIAQTGKAIKALSIKTESGGLTFAVTKRRDAAAAAAAQAIGSKHKYETKSDRWYVILDSIETANPIDGLLPLVWPWEEDEEEARYAVEAGKVFKSRKVERNVSDRNRTG